MSGDDRAPAEPESVSSGDDDHILQHSAEESSAEEHFADVDIQDDVGSETSGELNGREGKRYLRVYIHIRFRHARSRAQPLAWPVTLSAAGGTFVGPIWKLSPKGGMGLY